MVYVVKSLTSEAPSCVDSLLARREVIVIDPGAHTDALFVSAVPLH